MTGWHWRNCLRRGRTATLCGSGSAALRGGTIQERYQGLESRATMSENESIRLTAVLALPRSGVGLIRGSNPSGRIELKRNDFLHHFPGHHPVILTRPTHGTG